MYLYIFIMFVYAEAGHWGYVPAATIKFMLTSSIVLAVYNEYTHVIRNCMYTAADHGVCASCNHQCYAALWKRYSYLYCVLSFVTYADDGHGVCVINGHGGALFRNFPFAYTMYTVRATGFQHRLLNAAESLPITSCGL